MFRICRFCIFVLKLLVSLHFSITGTSSSAASNVTCLPSYNWTHNDCDQTPCEVAAWLISQCTDQQNTHYLGPTSPQDTNECECSSVVYSLVSACAVCQERNYLSWDAWKANCSSVYYSIFPKNIPIQTTVPVWAYANYSDLDEFDVFTAQSLASEKQPDSSFIPEPTTSNNLQVPHPASTTTTTSSSTTTTPTVMTTSADSPSPTTNEKNVESAARSRTIGIVIWVIVGLVAILGLSILSVYLTRRWRRYQERKLLTPRYHAVHSRENSQPEEMKELVRTTASSRISIPSMIPYVFFLL
ncbi:uncharacterized protein EV420DRAFT_292507 [Desarmillaria tabescens]|uniref:Mid2 domain-containing protein n=1 Tax=Armillaria tabescens TaxID=1929756 RepID=A0AA39KF28_ARMTA|nr:uncharacterized protein EV420DRAFT_292507 [Desarmillaria tabescens]KAK0459822.1 hypothetical protein EV420DRAFT_292507 [Desarmillaria tabescens]